jgi:SAM-dependent methyltransferase
MQHDQFQLHADIEERHWWFVGRRQILCRLIAEVLPPSPEAAIVDVGCGTGGNIAALACGYRCAGIDTSAEAVDLARQRFPQVRFIAGRAPRDLGDLAAQARLFMLTDVLEHVADDYAMLSELLAAASPGSYFLITVPADESLWSEHDESFGHYRRYDPARLEGVWKGLPVTTLLLSYFNARLLPMVRLVRAWNRAWDRSAGRAGTDFWLPSRPVNALLSAIFAGEAERLVAALRQDPRRLCFSITTRGGQEADGSDVMLKHNLRPYRAGASLVALLRRDAGPVAIRPKPAGLPPDHR